MDYYRSNKKQIVMSGKFNDVLKVLKYYSNKYVYVIDLINDLESKKDILN